jgi:hypothetical protein
MNTHFIAVLRPGLLALGLALGCETSARGAAEPVMTRLQVIQGSWLKIEGTTSIYDWRARSSDLAGFMEAAPGVLGVRAAVGGATENRSWAEMSLPVRSLKSIDLDGEPFSKTLDETIHLALRAEVQPIIHYRLLELVQRRSVAGGAQDQFESKGELSLAGVTNGVSMPVTVRADGRNFKVVGSATVKMSAFKIKPRLPALVDPGPMRYGDDVKVSFELLLQKSATDPGTKAQ